MKKTSKESKEAQSLPLAMTPSVDRVTAAAMKRQTAKLSDL